jgi:hypothetical protein
MQIQQFVAVEPDVRDLGDGRTKHDHGAGNRIVHGGTPS